MQATIDTKFVNKKLIRIYSFRQFSSLNTRQMYLKRSNVAKTSHNPPYPLKYHTVPPPFQLTV